MIRIFLNFNQTSLKQFSFKNENNDESFNNPKIYFKDLNHSKILKMIKF
jgi:hypothetical protein